MAKSQADLLYEQLTGSGSVADKTMSGILSGGGSSIGAKVQYGGYAPGRFYLPDGAGMETQDGNTYLTFVTNKLYACGTYSPSKDSTVASWSIYIATLGAGSTVKAGLWKTDDNGLPTTLHADLGSVSAATAGIKTTAATAALTKGSRYLLAVVSQGGSPSQTPSWSQSSSQWGIENANIDRILQYGMIEGNSLSADGVSGALGTFPTLNLWDGATNHIMPRVGLSFS